MPFCIFFSLFTFLLSLFITTKRQKWRLKEELAPDCPFEVNLAHKQTTDATLAIHPKGRSLNRTHYNIHLMWRDDKYSTHWFLILMSLRSDCCSKGNHLSSPLSMKRPYSLKILLLFYLPCLQNLVSVATSSFIEWIPILKMWSICVHQEIVNTNLAMC